MGAGKTSVGRILAERLGWHFVDLDDVVERREGRTVSAIFEESGEAGFREAETAALREVLMSLRAAPLVVALGGGTFVQPHNAEAIRKSSVPVVFLDAPVEEVDTMPGFYALVTRKMKDGRPFYPEQCMTRGEALKSYTLDGAYAGFEEASKGSLTPGKLADIVVLSDDFLYPQRVPDEAIRRLTSVLTIVGGRIVHNVRVVATH
jgi:hypothetical protein